MKQEKRALQIFARICFLAYCALMLWLLFGRSQYEIVDNYWDRMQQNVNLEPLATIQLYIHVLEDPDLAYLIPHAIVNLAGNVVMFIPLGFFLPVVFPMLRKFWKTLTVTALIISVIEIVQLFTLVGSCDVDDLMLNVVGAGIGYLLYRIINRIRK